VDRQYYLGKEKEMVNSAFFCVFATSNIKDAYLKDDFPLLVMELMINSTIGLEALSFMHCMGGYNQIQMTLEDQEVTAFRTKASSATR